MAKPLLLAVNGERVQVAQPDPCMTLLTYIRTFTRFKGTKLGCEEGGCGACVVFVSKYDPVSKRVEERTVNSCLALLCSFHLCAITTTEGLKHPVHGPHAIHQRIAGFHATQCGFCTPGVAMSLYGCIRRAGAAAQGAAGAAVPGLTAAEAERAVQGHICRCTGYRPILDACKSFAEDVDLEDLGINAFWSRTEGARRAALPAYSRGRDPRFPHFLRHAVEEEHARLSCWEGSRFVDGGVEERVWIVVRSLDDLFRELSKYEGRDKEVRLVVGNTSSGIFKVRPPEVVLIDISGVPELLGVRNADGRLEVGAAVSLSKLVSALEETPDSVVHAAFAAHLKRSANLHVRNWGSLGGNLILAQQHSFNSDVATVLLAAGAWVKVGSAAGKASAMSVEEFLDKGALEPGSVLLSVVVPSWVHENLVFKTFRASDRPLGNASSYVNAAFWAQFAAEAGGYVISQVRLAFGAFGSKHSVLAHQVEKLLTGKQVTPQLLLEAIEVLKAAVVPAQGTLKAAYRSSLLVGYFFDFFRPYLGVLEAQTLNDGVHGTVATGARSDASSCSMLTGKLERLTLEAKTPAGDGSLQTGDLGKFQCKRGANNKALTTGRQKVALSNDFFPVGQPTTKVAAELQASGEAVYVDDLPSPLRCLHAAFVMSDQAWAEVKAIDGSRALKSPGAVSLVTAKDIPRRGKNVGVSLFGVEEPLFATTHVEYHGHPLGLLVADSPQHARQAARKVDVTYCTNNVGPPILSIEDAVANNSYIDIPPYVSSLSAPVGDVKDGFSRSDLKIEDGEVFSGHQYHFYMEMQSVLVVPDEDGQLIVYSACQSTENVQLVVATCVGIPVHNVRVITRRLGGGFGGKVTKACIVAAACALAAWKLKRPVRMYLDRKSDMLIVGGRSPVKALYSVGFNRDGKILALQTKVYINSGNQPDWTVFLPMLIHSSTKKYNWGAFAGEYKVVKTNTSSKTVVRGPGDLQGAFIAETVIEHVAATLGLSAQEVRETNFHSVESASRFYGVSVGGVECFTLPAIWEQLKVSSDLVERKKDIEEFNERSKWRKRGLAMVPVVYSVTVMQNNGRVTIFGDGSVVVEVGGIEMGQGLWTKVKQATAYGLSQLWDKPGPGGVNISKIRLVQSDSVSLGNSGLTAGGTTSEGNCLAVLDACKILVERLRPIKKKMEAANSKCVTWETVVTEAKMAGVDLSAQALTSIDLQSTSYVNFGAAVSEVEIDAITGETVTLRSDLLYDCGKSMNPAVDIGQVEGAFVQGIGFFLTEEIQFDAEGRQLTEGTWLYKPPTLDNIPRVLNVELLNSTPQKRRILSSKASGEPPLLLAASVHCAVRNAISAAKQDIYGSTGYFRLDSSTSMDKVKTHCGLDNVEHYLSSLIKLKEVLEQ